MGPLSSLPSATIFGDVMSAITSSLQSGPFGIPALLSVTWSVVLPLTLYKKVYGIGVAYGFSVFLAGWTMLQVLAPGPLSSPLSAGMCLAAACMFYGVRLGGYLLLRDATRKPQLPSSIKNGSIPSRVTFSLSLALFYAFLTTPTLFALREPSTSTIAWLGTGIAWVGALLEAIADLQKYLVKQAHKDDADTSKFIGPTSFAYRISRHPNYLGEVLFWIGVFMGGLPSFGTSISAWICSILGVTGITSIMLKATDGLEKRQTEKYGGQEAYDTWRKEVTSSLIPFIK